jgi:hypothetical protein
MDPNVLREIVRKAIEDEIEPAAWRRCEALQKAENKSLEKMVKSWTKQPPPRPRWIAKKGPYVRRCHATTRAKMRRVSTAKSKVRRV